MAKIVKTIFQFRRAHTTEWLANGNVKPAAGEPCFDLDLHELRIGDGTTMYKDLPVIGGVKLELAADGKSIVFKDDVFKLMGYDAAEIGAQPQKTEEGLKWVVPSTEAVDTLRTDVTNLQKTVVNIQEIVTPSGEDSVPLLTRIESLETKMDGAGEGTVDAKIDAKIEAFASALTPNDDKVNTLMELINFVESHGKEALDMAADITELQGLVGNVSVEDRIAAAGHITKAEAEETLLSKVEAASTLKRIKYEVCDTPIGTLVDYRDKEIRVMVPENAVWTKQAVGVGGDANSYYMTFKTYAPDNAVGYIEHLGDQIDAEILTNFSTDKYGRRYQPTWLSLAKYDATNDTWTYHGSNSSQNKYIGWDYQIDWYDANGVMIASDSIRINLSNEDCHNVIEPYYMANAVKKVAVNGTLLDMIDGRVDIVVPEIKGSDEIEVAEDGTLRIKSISFDKIAQDEETTIIMDGGSAF